MRVGVYPADHGGCGHYRLIWPAQALADQGADVVLRDGEAWDDIQATVHIADDGTKTIVAVDAGDVDVVVLQRPLRRELVESIPLLQQGGMRVVVDIDDDFSCIHPRNVSWRSCHPTYSPERNYLHLAEACRRADLVTVSTPALAERYGRHGRTVVLPNCVPARYLDVAKPAHDGVFVGWTGSIDTHPDDLHVTRGGVARALAAGGEFAVVGTGKGVKAALGLPQQPRAAGWVDISVYAAAVAEFDIGVVPLADTRFNQAKSWLKGLEMAAVGVPFVASPTVEYRRLHAEGGGLLAARPRDWQRHTETLIRSTDARAELAARGRQTAARWTVEGNTHRWWDAWSSVLARTVAA